MPAIGSIRIYRHLDKKNFMCISSMVFSLYSYIHDNVDN